MQKSVSPIAAILVIFAMVAVLAFLWMRFTEAPEAKQRSTVIGARGRESGSMAEPEGRRGSGLERSASGDPESSAPGD